MRKSVISPILAILGLGFLVATGVALLVPVLPLRFVPLALLLTGIATIVAAALFIRSRVLRPLERMVQTLRRVDEQNFVVRCRTGDDEPGRLGLEVNMLLQRLTDLSINVIDTDRELQWTQKELKLKEELAEKSRLLQATNDQLETRLKELSLLFSVSRSLSSSLDLNVLLPEFCRSGVRAMEVDRSAILVWNERRNALEVRGASGFDDASGPIVGMRAYPGEGVSGTVFEKKTMLYIRDLANDQRFLHFRGKAKLTGSLLGLPLPLGDRCVGVMLLNRSRREAFSFEDVGLFHIIANQVAGAVGNALLYQKTRELASHDELTRLYNRRTLERRLEMEWERSRRFDTTLACIMIDVDHFKQFNDQHGHLVGDEVLKHVGALLMEHTRKVDSVARFGGEEFAVLLPRTEKDEAHAVAEKLRAAVADQRLVSEQGEEYALTISAGVASTKDSPTSAKQLIDLADHGLLLAKSRGRNQVVDYGANGFH